MSVVYVCVDPGVPVFGRKGASVHVQAVLRVLAGRGGAVHLLAARIGGPVPSGLEAVHVHELPTVSGDNPVQREEAARRTDAAVAAALDALAAAGPVHLVYERYSLWGRTATAWAAASGVPSVLEVNAPLVEETARHRVLVDRTAAEDVAAQALSAAGVVACVSDAVAVWARRLARDPERVVVAPNGVDTDRVRPAPWAPRGTDRTPFTVGFVGTLKPWHGVETLVDALAVLHAAEPYAYRLLVVGDGPLGADLRLRAARRGVSHLVEWTGAVDPDAVPAHLQRMDVGTAPYPSQDCYFSPLKVYEYLAAGLPVVASAVGQVPEALDAGRLGVLVPAGDAPQLAAAVATLRADRPRREQLSSVGRRAAVEQHAWESVVGRVLDCLPQPVGA